MYQFDNYPDKSHSGELIYNLINSSNYTAQKYGYNAYNYFIISLKRIVKNNMYDYITREGQYRKIVSKYSPSAYFGAIVNTLIQKGYNLSNYVSTYGGKYFVREDCIDILINEFCKIMANNIMNNVNANSQNNAYSNNQQPNSVYGNNQQVQVNNSQSNNIYSNNPQSNNAYRYNPQVNNFNSYNPQPQNVRMYHPSDFLRKSIVEDTQTKSGTKNKFTSYTFNGMAGYSHVGKRRSNQEDSYYIGFNRQNPEFKILVVADGMGGSKQGEIASNIAVRELMEWFDTIPSGEYYQKDNKRLAYLLQQKVYDIQRKISKTVFNGGTTLCVSIIKNNSILMGNVGDSQGYIIKNDKMIYATTPDSVPITLGVPKEIARYHKSNNVINNYLGNLGEDDFLPSISISETKLKKHNTYKVVMCSDGVTDCISERKIIDIINNSNNPSQALVEYAIENNSYLLYDFNLLKRKDRDKVIELYGNGVLNDNIKQGKDNTTAVSASIRR